MKKKPRPTVVEKIAAKQAPRPEINPTDIANVIVAARRGLGTLGGQDLVNVSTSIARLEAALAQISAPAAAPEATPPATPAEPAKA